MTTLLYNFGSGFIPCKISDPVTKFGHKDQSQRKQLALTSMLTLQLRFYQMVILIHHQISIIWTAELFSKLKALQKDINDMWDFEKVREELVACVEELKTYDPTGASTKELKKSLRDSINESEVIICRTNSSSNRTFKIHQMQTEIFLLVLLDNNVNKSSQTLSKLYPNLDINWWNIVMIKKQNFVEPENISGIWHPGLTAADLSEERDEKRIWDRF